MIVFIFICVLLSVILVQQTALDCKQAELASLRGELQSAANLRERAADADALEKERATLIRECANQAERLRLLEKTPG